MARIEYVGIKELKNNLSAWIERVRRGSPVLVTLATKWLRRLDRPKRSLIRNILYCHRDR